MLSDFRARLAGHGLEEKIFEVVLETVAVHPSRPEEVLAGQEERWLNWYGERIGSWHGELPGADREKWLRQVGEDGFFLLGKVDDVQTPVWLP